MQNAKFYINKTMPRKKAADELPNFYTQLPKNLKRVYHNPEFKKHQINIPFRMIICGSSGSGKTNTFLQLIKIMKGTFNKIVICCKSKDEPLYQLLADKIPDDMLTFYEGIDAIPPVSSFENGQKEQILICFDDLVLEKNQKVIEEYYIRGRKTSGGISSVYISQDYFSIPTKIRRNCSYIILKRLSSLDDLKRVLREYNLGINKDTMVEIYKRATNTMENFLFIDIDAPLQQRFRMGFTQYIN